MTGFFNHFAAKEANDTYFVGANTPDGFVGDFDKLFSEGAFRKVFIIKGGSGTGKSTMMRRAAEAAKAEGVKVTYLLCSSDPDSLDGVLLEKSGVKIAIADGTVPHTLDPIYAGACGEIVNSGDCWNTEYLENSFYEISEIINKKKDCYSAAYRYISGAAEAWNMALSLGRGCILYDKMISYANRITAALPKGKNRIGTVTGRRTYAISMKGAVRLTVFENVKNCFGVEDVGGTAAVFMKIITDAFLLRGFDVTVSQSPFGGICEVLIPEADMSFVVRRDGAEYCKNVNLRRFIDKEKFHSVKEKRKFATSCFEAMTDGALESLSEAWSLHAELEEIYKKGMDFSALDKMTEGLGSRIISYFQN